jgi:DNA-binding HxlR family transcriptional regulator
MGSSSKTDHRAFTKAVEHLGDRWSFLIVRELAMFGAQRDEDARSHLSLPEPELGIEAAR